MVLWVRVPRSGPSGGRGMVGWTDLRLVRATGTWWWTSGRGFPRSGSSGEVGGDGWVYWPEACLSCWNPMMDLWARVPQVGSLSWEVGGGWLDVLTWGLFQLPVPLYGPPGEGSPGRTSRGEVGRGWLSVLTWGLFKLPVPRDGSPSEGSPGWVSVHRPSDTPFVVVGAEYIRALPVLW